MPIYKGSTKLGTIYHGGTEIGKVYKGSTLVFSSQLSVYNIYRTNQVKDGFVGYFLGEPRANITLAGYATNQQNLLTAATGTIASINGTTGAAGSSLTARLFETDNYGPYNYKDNFIDSYGGVWYRYVNTVTFYLPSYVLLSPFHTTVGSQLINVMQGEKAVFSSDASTVTIYYSYDIAPTVYNAASTLIGTFQYK